jgi:hypothetical protein
MGGKGGSDSSGMAMAMASAQAAMLSYQLGGQQLQFSQQQWADYEPMLNANMQSQTALQNEQVNYTQEQEAISQQVANVDIQAQQQQNDFTNQENQYYLQNYQPLESQYLNQVENWDTPAQEAQNAGAAEATVNTNFNNQRQAAAQQLEAFGVNPTSTRFAALDMGSRDQQAAAAAGQGTAAIEQTKLAGMGLEAGAINTGRGYANNSASLANSSTAAGQGATSASAGEIGAANSAVGAGSAANSTALGAIGSMSSALSSPTAWFNAGANNMGVYVNAVNGFNYAQNQANQMQSSMFSGLGSAAGGLLGFFADGGPVPDGSTPIPSAPTTGGVIPSQASPSGGQQTDDVPAQLTSGEFVVPRDVVQWQGEKSMYDLINKSRTDKQKVTQNSPVGGRAVAAIPARPNFVSRPMQSPSQGAIPSRMAA